MNNDIYTTILQMKKKTVNCNRCFTFVYYIIFILKLVLQLLNDTW